MWCDHPFSQRNSESRGWRCGELGGQNLIKSGGQFMEGGHKMVGAKNPLLTMFNV